MKSFIVNFDNSLSIQYELNDCPIIDHWISLIQKRNVSELCQNNHVSGIIDKDLIDSKVTRFYELIDIINLYSPRKIEKVFINDDNWRQAFEKMHIHFPELKNDNDYENIHDVLTEYNDIIHWLETTYVAKMTKNSLLRITLDFNKSIYEFYELPSIAYHYCEPFVEFGDLTLHYTHVGRHALEQFMVNDLICPKEQFVPQTTYNASVRLSFNDLCAERFNTKENLLKEWHNFYSLKGGIDYWGYKITDPNIQFGFIKIGSLKQVIKDKQLITEKSVITKLITSNKIINWLIKGA